MQRVGVGDKIDHSVHERLEAATMHGAVHGPRAWEDIETRISGTDFSKGCRRAVCTGESARHGPLLRFVVGETGAAPPLNPASFRAKNFAYAGCHDVPVRHMCSSDLSNARLREVSKGGCVKSDNH